jgi:hypothetical protein
MNLRFFTLSKKRGSGAEWRRARKPQNSSSFWPSVALAEKAVGVKKPSIRRSERDSAAFADGFDAVFGRFFGAVTRQTARRAPLEVVKAARWLQDPSHANLREDQLAEAVWAERI